MYLKFIVNFSLYLCLFMHSQTIADEVPAILWNIKGNALNIKPVSALERDDHTFKDNMESLMNNDVNVLVFAMNQLSMEDFSSNAGPVSLNNTIKNLQNFLDSTPYMFLSSVKDPLAQLHKVHCGVQEIVVEQNIDKNILQSISLAFGQSCVVILHITDSGVFGTKDPQLEDIKKVFQPSFMNSPESIIGIFTSDKSSWTSSSNEHHILRNMLQVNEAEADNNFVNITGCLFMYVQNVSVQVIEKNISMALTLPPVTTGSSCGNQTSVLQLAFKMSGDVTGLTVKFDFTSEKGSWITKATIAITGKDVPEGDWEANSDIIEAPIGFSFNCGNLKLRTKNNTNDVIVKFVDFQVQPFAIKDDKFSASIDCVPFFTVPIWMGVFVSLLFIIIINVGVYALFSVHTMDRFDDPKGKTISVAVSGD